MGNWQLRAMTASRAEVIRSIAADALFREDAERSVGAVRACVWNRISQVLGDDTTSQELFHACCGKPPRSKP